MTFDDFICTLPQIFIIEDDDTGGQVAEDPDNEEQGVDDSQRDEGLVIDMGGSCIQFFLDPEDL